MLNHVNTLGSIIRLLELFDHLLDCRHCHELFSSTHITNLPTEHVHVYYLVRLPDTSNILFECNILLDLFLHYASSTCSDIVSVIVVNDHVLHHQRRFQTTSGWQ